MGVWVRLSDIVWDSGEIPRGINPNIALIDDILHFGLPLYVRTTSIEPGLCYVNSEREVFYASDNELGRRRLALRSPDIYGDLRWPMEDVHRFVNGDDSCQRNPSAVLLDIVKLLKQYIEFENQEDYIVAALWIVGTYLQPVWDAYPYLSITGFIRTGKTKTLMFITQLAFNAISSLEMTAPMLYRTVQSLRCSLLIDEAEDFKDPEKHAAIRHCLHAGYKRSGRIIRGVGDRHTPTFFELFSPKALVSYEGVEQIIEDRCINIVMIRSIDQSIATAVIRAEDIVWGELRAQLYRFALTHYREVREGYRNISPAGILIGRPLELWAPILSLSKFFGVYEKVKKHAISLTKQKEEENVAEARALILLRCLVSIVDEDRMYTCSEIKATMFEQLDETVEWLQVRWIGRCLANTFNFKERGRTRRGRTYRLWPKRIQYLCRRYGIGYAEELALHSRPSIEGHKGHEGHEKTLDEAFKKHETR